MVTVICAECEEILDEPTNLPESERKPCPSCGSISRVMKVVLSDSATAHDGLRLKARHGSVGRPYLEAKVGEEIYRKEQKWVNRSMRIDRDKNKYTESVVDKETGEIIHHCDELLSDHQGHGTAKGKKDKKV